MTRKMNDLTHLYTKSLRLTMASLKSKGKLMDERVDAEGSRNLNSLTWQKFLKHQFAEY